jgi:hypothetical protein
MKTPALFLTLCLLSPVASADIFKCSDSKGNVKYQNFPCPIDSIGSQATAVPPKEDSVKPAAQTAARQRPALTHIQPQPGMKMNDVRAGIGPPKMSKVINGVEIWYYEGPSGTTRGVHFDRTGTVLAINEREQPPPPEED